MDFVTVARTTELLPGQCKVVEAAGRQIALYNVGGTFYATDNTCKHRGGPLGEGELEGNIVTCPWHGWQWDVTTGRSEFNPATAVACYETRVEGDEVKIAV